MIHVYIYKVEATVIVKVVEVLVVMVIVGRGNSCGGRRDSLWWCMVLSRHRGS